MFCRYYDTTDLPTCQYAFQKNSLQSGLWIICMVLSNKAYINIELCLSRTHSKISQKTFNLTLILMIFTNFFLKLFSLCSDEIFMQIG
jgi:hypothetical protein